MATLFGKTVMKLIPVKSWRRALVNSSSAKMRWRLALPCEENYWERFIAEKGPEYPADYQARVNPETELQADIRQHINAQAGATVRILDVGAGPLTYVGKRWPGHTVEVTAIDPLADDYNRLLNEYHVEPPVRTINCAAEKIAERFPADHFDLTYSRNALDHSYDPAAAIENMVHATRPGCVTLLIHAINEGEYEKYYGLHQWNFNKDEHGHFIVWGKAATVDMTQRLADRATVTCDIQDCRIITVIRKHASQTGASA